MPETGENFSRISNYHVSVKEINGKVIFLRKMVPLKKSEVSKWTPQKQTFINNEDIANEIYGKGYQVVGRLDDSTIEKLSELYSALHDFQRPSGGMFYSLYSKDVEYRRKVHDGIGEILKPLYDSLFHDYKIVLNSYIVKVSGPESEFCLHQDSTSLDETRYSNISVWIPLQDTDFSNGCMSVVPYSQKMFSPYRGISFDPPFENISDTVRKYLQPIFLKKGDILLFDNRLVHNSVINSSGKDRVVVMSGVYPAQAPIISCYKEAEPNSPIELIQQEEDFLLTYPNFKNGCRCRPETGHSIGFVKWSNRQMTEREFISLCDQYHLQPTNIPELLTTAEVQTGLDDPAAH